MPNGFPAFRYDPTTAPRYLIKTTKTSPDTASDYTSSSKQSAKTTQPSEDQYPTERDPPKKSHSKPKGKFERLFG